MSALEVLGWIGATLIVLSLMQARVLRFRWMNLTGAVISMVVNGLLSIWPFAAMNAVIAAIDVYWILRLTRERHDQSVYDVVEVGVSDAYLHHVMRVHAGDVATTHPTISLADVLPPSDRASEAPGGSVVNARGVGRFAFLVLRGDETVGLRPGPRRRGRRCQGRAGLRHTPVPGLHTGGVRLPPVRSLRGQGLHEARRGLRARPERLLPRGRVPSRRRPLGASGRARCVAAQALRHGLQPRAHSVRWMRSTTTWGVPNPSLPVQRTTSYPRSRSWPSRIFSLTYADSSRYFPCPSASPMSLYSSQVKSGYWSPPAVTESAAGAAARAVQRGACVRR